MFSIVKLNRHPLNRVLTAIAFIGSLCIGTLLPITTSHAAIKYTAIGTGALHSCALSSDGDVYCWGNNEVGQLGFGKAGDPLLVPTKVPGLPKVASISVGVLHTCAVAISGTAFCWGDNKYGKLGAGEADAELGPIQVKGLSDIVQISANRFGTCAVTEKSKAFCWGENSTGSIGDGTKKSSAIPVAVSGDFQFKEIRTSNFHTCAISSADSLYCWGENTNGQIGIPDLESALTPQLITFAGRIKHLTTGAGHTCVIDEDGFGNCWGYGEKGQIGNGETSAKAVPFSLKSLGKLISIEGARFHTCALTAKYESFCWGAGEVGQLGNGKTSSSTIPVEVLNLKNSRVLGAASSFSASTCVLDSAGAFHCWGDGQAGQLGIGSRNSLSAPLTSTSSSTEADTSSPTSGLDLSIVIKCKKSGKILEIKGRAPKCPTGSTVVKEVKPKSIFYLDLKEGCYSQNFPVTNQVLRSGPTYKTLYPASCNGRYHLQTIFSGTMKTKSPNGLPTQAEASEFCGQKYVAAMGSTPPNKVSENATYIYWFFADAGFEARKYPGKIVCNLMKTDISYTYLLAQSKPLSKSTV